MIHLVRLMVSLSLLLLANGSEAANLLVNPDFDQTTALSG